MQSFDRADYRSKKGAVRVRDDDYGFSRRIVGSQSLLKRSGVGERFCPRNCPRQRLQLARRVGQILFARDVVAIEDAAGCCWPPRQSSFWVELDFLTDRTVISIDVALFSRSSMVE